MLIKVLTYNIHKGFNFSGRRLVINDIKQQLLHSFSDWDIVFLQEVVGENTRHAKRLSDWPVVSQHQFLASDNWEYGVYGESRKHKLGNHGNSILSRFEIHDHFNQNVSTYRLEKRGVLHSKLVPNSDIYTNLNIWASCVHLDLSRWGQRIQLNRLTGWIDQNIPKDAPLILAGDFNDRSQETSHYLKKSLQLSDTIVAPTFPSFLPIVSLDRIYTRGFRQVDAGVLKGHPWSKLSDHLPVYSILELIKN